MFMNQMDSPEVEHALVRMNLAEQPMDLGWMWFHAKVTSGGFANLKDLKQVVEEKILHGQLDIMAVKDELEDISDRLVAAVKMSRDKERYLITRFIDIVVGYAGLADLAEQVFPVQGGGFVARSLSRIVERALQLSDCLLTDDKELLQLMRGLKERLLIDCGGKRFGLAGAVFAAAEVHRQRANRM